MRILITSDFHGNRHQVRKLQEIALKVKPDVFVYVGDLGPIRSKYPTVDSQYKFVKTEIMDKICEMDIKHKIVIPGNTDFYPVNKMFEKEYTDPSKALFVMNKQLSVKGINMAFFTTVTYTTHCLKDMEAQNKYEISEELLQKKKSVNHIFSRETPLAESNIVTTSDGLKYDTKYFEIFANFDSLPDHYKQRLQNTMYDQISQFKPTGRTLIFSHAPPYNTNADMCSRKQNAHSGSLDIRKYIEDYQPEAIFSGHIHESVLMSGSHIDNILDTRVYTIGNTGIDGPNLFLKVAFLVYDTETKECERIVEDCPPEDLFVTRHFE
ncbi:Calcineurin-like_phosphoesterase [Hexamita inflata]|uniref:Calcineurin-like phosphoesterase n=1 Tax=Hexamita inflata TaxID=28002 RepID=A0AA86QCS3_9EUKA|nr:Calcineurin-like phosphoesterase [Hexamita inflata]